MDKLFIETLMDYIMEATMIPKSQIERAVGPILSMFLPVVLTETFRQDQNLSGSLVMVSPEFPLKKEDNWQSTNIDWLLYNTVRRQLLFVELKTSDTSINDNQNSIYHRIQAAIVNRGAAFLIEDMEQMRDRSSEFGKYQYVLKTKVTPLKNEISACHDAKLIYLIPKSIELKVHSHADTVLTFGMLSASIPGNFAKEWGIIRNHLCALDDSSRSSRNCKSAISSPTRVTAKSAHLYIEKNSMGRKSVNWQGTLDFRHMFNLCLQQEDNIVVGFMGGSEAFARSTLAELQSRLYYKWDYAKNMAGKKNANWLFGKAIIHLLRQYHGYPNNLR